MPPGILKQERRKEGEWGYSGLDVAGPNYGISQCANTPSIWWHYRPAASSQLEWHCRRILCQLMVSGSLSHVEYESRRQLCLTFVYSRRERYTPTVPLSTQEKSWLFTSCFALLLGNKHSSINLSAFDDWSPFRKTGNPTNGVMVMGLILGMRYRSRGFLRSFLNSKHAGGCIRGARC